jgi:DNA modification methylase
VIKIGEIVLKNDRCTLWHGDCLEVMKGIPDGSVDLVLADPPYGNTSCKWDSVIPFEPMWEQLNRVTKKNAAILLFGSEPFSSALRMSNIKAYKYDWVWNKKKSGSGFLAKSQPLKIHELVSVFNSKRYYPQMIRGEMKNKKSYGSKPGSTTGAKKKSTDDNFNDMYYPKSIIELSNASQGGKVHPTQKPVDLREYLIRTYSQEGETVLDFTMGSGSTGVAALNTNRKFIGIELDTTYCGIAKQRILDIDANMHKICFL